MGNHLRLYTNLNTCVCIFLKIEACEGGVILILVKCSSLILLHYFEFDCIKNGKAVLHDVVHKTPNNIIYILWSLLLVSLWKYG